MNSKCVSRSFENAFYFLLRRVVYEARFEGVVFSRFYIVVVGMSLMKIFLVGDDRN